MRLPEIAIGLILMVGFALAAVLWHLSSVDREPLLALAADLQRGEVVDLADLRTVYVATDDPLAYIPASAADELVGNVATADLQRGTVLTPTLVVDREPVTSEEGVVGLALDAGQFPAAGLRPGDLVNVVLAPADGVPTPRRGQTEAAVVLAQDASVFAVEELGEDDRQFISLRLLETEANAVAAAAEAGGLRLVLVGGAP
jgi:hypothetical protein